MNLEPIDPQTAVELYLADRETELRRSTINAHRSRLRFFVRWCEEREITNLNDLIGRLLHRYRIWRRNDGDLAPPSEKSQMDTIRVFIRWLGTVDGVDPDLHLKVRSPNFHKSEHARSAMIDSETAEAVLAYLEKYEYANRDHVAVALLWHTMLRAGGLRALDLDGYEQEEQFLAVVDRPETGTPLKNGKSGQRFVGLTSEVCMVLDDYVQTQRVDVTDEYGREPLVTTQHGRILRGTIRKGCYSWSRPAWSGWIAPTGGTPTSVRQP